MTITDYKVISNDSLDIFNKEVNKLLGEGWKLRGNLVMTSVGTYHGRLYSQVLIKES